jgi:DNA polymerase III epsilon subunit-like protein
MVAKYFLFDTETTGNGEQDRIIQVGGILVHSKNEIEVFDELCSCDVPISIEAMAVHHITPQMIESKPSFLQTNFHAKLIEYNSLQNYLIAHNISFDTGMLQKEGFVNNYTIIDTLRCAKHLLPHEQSHALQYLRYSLGLYSGEQSECDTLNVTIKAHDAIGDVVVMKLLLSKLVQELRAKNSSSNPMEELARLTQTPVLIDMFKFGKYKGRKVAEIAKEDSGYLKWMKNNMELDEDLIYTLNYYNIN